MNPVIIIATHNRHEITSLNLLTLQGYQVVIVVSTENEKQYYNQFDCHTVMAPNCPLGLKWSIGVNYARLMDHSHIIITGSDDILAKGYIDSVCKTNYDFTGLRQWHVLHKERLYLFDYKADGLLPLGGGRCYSKKLLESCDYKIFDCSADRLLDDQGFEIVKSFGNYQLLNESQILAVKGDWPTMNPFANHLRSKNAKLLKVWKGEEVGVVLKNKFSL